VDGKIYKVFVSSTYEDLREERAAVQKALLQLGCFPVGMELFPAADDETWKFIKSQIDDADYYVVIVAGKYGSTAPNGISFTEKEYDYALSIKKPTIGFVHGNPGLIIADRIERDADKRAKLDAFLKKVKERLVRSYTNPHELALEVTTSFVSLIRERPAEGYVRSSTTVDYKRYAELLEENKNLKATLEAALSLAAETRPKIRIKHLWLADDIWGGQQVRVNLGIVNTGTAVATVHQIGVRFAVARADHPIPFDPNIPNLPGIPTGTQLVTGVWMTIQGIGDGTTLTNEQSTHIQQEQSNLYCIGYVSYFDTATNAHNWFLQSSVTSAEHPCSRRQLPFHQNR
jgi:hypothetical protein